MLPTFRQYITVSIPHELPAAIVNKRETRNEYQTNRLIRYIDTWLLLKNITSTGVIQNYKQQIEDLTTLTQLTTKTFLSRIDQLQQIELIECRNGNIYLASWKDLGKYFDIDINSFFKVKYKSNEKKKIHQIITALEIEQAQDLQREVLLLRIAKNPEYKTTIEKIMIDAGADITRLKDPVYFQQSLWQLQILSFQKLQSGTEREFFINYFRADVNRTVHTIQKAYNYKSAQSISYIKKKLSAAGIIEVKKQCIESTVRARKKDTWMITINDKDVVKHPYVTWLEKKKQTMWCGADNIIVKVNAGTDFKIDQVRLKIAA